MADKKGLFVFRCVWASRIPVHRTEPLPSREKKREDKEEVGSSRLESGGTNSVYGHTLKHM